MPITGTQVESLALPERLPLGQAIDNYSTFTYSPVQPDPNGTNRWLAGVTFVPHGVGTSVLVQTEDPCVQLLNSFAARQGFGDPVTFLPFRIDNSITCSMLGGFTQEQLEMWILEETRSLESYDLAKQVWGTGGPNPTLRNTADVVTTADVTPVGALAAVVSGMSRRLKGSRGLVHVTPDMLVWLQAAGAVRTVSGHFEVAAGHRLVADDGYDGSGPAGLALGTSWIYGSGPVYAKLSSPQDPAEWWESFNEIHNDFNAQVSRYGIYVFEPDFVVGAAATVATTST